MREEHDNFYVDNEGTGLLFDDGEGNRVFRFRGGGPLVFSTAEYEGPSGGCYGYVVKGEAQILHNDRFHVVHAGQWFATEDDVLVGLKRDIDAEVVVVQKQGHKGQFGIGQVEPEGRLCYIDGAMDTILQGPWRKGEACFNALYLPTGIHQTMHTHPSTRVGIVWGGYGHCETRVDQHVMRPGTVFFMPSECWHKFRTDFDGAENLRLLAFHPDSDHGPSDEEHPMLNRTMVDGVSAKDMDDIRTKREG